MIRSSVHWLFASVLAVAASPGPASAHRGDPAGPRHVHALAASPRPAAAREATRLVALAPQQTRAAAAANSALVSGQGDLRFRVLYRSDHLPAEARDVLAQAHGGFAVDRREGRGEIFFALPGAGIIRLSADLKSTRMVKTPPEMKDVTLHNTTLWLGEDATPYLAFPSLDPGRIFTTDLDGELLHTLDPPGNDEDFNDDAVIEYFRSGGTFIPTDVEYLLGLYYITTGYSPLDYVLTAEVRAGRPFQANWNNLVFGGRGTGRGQFGRGHGITVAPEGNGLDVADRPNAAIKRFTPSGHYQSVFRLPEGSFVCDIDYAEGLAIVACLHGPDPSKGAPIYILRGDRVVSTIMAKEDLGLENFQHVHNAVLLAVDGRLIIVAQAWDPGDFAILEQVTD